MRCVRCAEIATVRLEYALGNAEPEPGATRLPVARRHAAIERREQMRQVVRGDARYAYSILRLGLVPPW
jgi:hypothetical protein